MDNNGGHQPIVLHDTWYKKNEKNFGKGHWNKSQFLKEARKCGVYQGLSIEAF